jgi:hypothetical protein
MRNRAEIGVNPRNVAGIVRGDREIDLFALVHERILQKREKGEGKREKEGQEGKSSIGA